MAPDPTPIASPLPKSVSGFRRLLRRASLAYGLVLVIASVALYSASDRWWGVTAGILFGPRWILAAPWVLLAVCAMAFDRRSLRTLLPIGVLLGIGFLNFNVPWHSLSGGGGQGQKLRLLTCNVHRHELNCEEFGRLLALENPDVILLQEWMGRNETALAGVAHLHVARHGEFCIVSRFPILDVQQITLATNRFKPIAMRYRLDVSGRPIDVFSVHLTSPHTAFEEVIRRSSAGPAAVDSNSALRAAEHAELKAQVSTSLGPVLLAGDFNTPPESVTFRQTWGEVQNAFTSAGWGLGRTYFTHWASMRIDHVLVSPGWGIERCAVGPDVGSVHRPLVAELRLPAASH